MVRASFFFFFFPCIADVCVNSPTKIFTESIHILMFPHYGFLILASEQCFGISSPELLRGRARCGRWASGSVYILLVLNSGWCLCYRYNPVIVLCVYREGYMIGTRKQWSWWPRAGARCTRLIESLITQRWMTHVSYLSLGWASS